MRFITFSGYRRVALLSAPGAADQVRDAVDRVRGPASDRAFELFAWVIMPEHVHLLVRLSPRVRWVTVSTAFKTSVARRMLSAWKKSNDPCLDGLRTPHGEFRFWQHGGGFDRNVRDDTEFAKTARYIHRNPVERGLVERAEDWKWSSVRWWMGRREGEMECDPPPGRPGDWDLWTGFV